MNQAWVRPIIIAGSVVILLALNAREFAGKRRALASEHQCGSAAGFGADQHHNALKSQSSSGSHAGAGLQPEPSQERRMPT